jgi:hypothetical protein
MADPTSAAKAEIDATFITAHYLEISTAYSFYGGDLCSTFLVIGYFKSLRSFTSALAFLTASSTPSTVRWKNAGPAS